MSTPTVDIGPVRPSFKAANSTPDPAPDFGPDFTKTPASEPREVPKTTRQRTKDSKPSGVTSLGQNKKLRSPVRKLTREVTGDELSDLEKLTARYRGLGKMAQMFHPRFAAAVTEQAEDCALSWFELAEQNDTVRRWILAVLEGGAWGGVIAAHTPIFLAVIPERTLNQFFLKGMGMFARRAEEETGEPIFPNWGQQE